MSNYRVRQVLALGDMPNRQLRLLVALATWMDDDSRSVKVGFGALAAGMGTSADTARRARRDACEAKRISYAPGRGRGHVTVWTVECLPEKGVQHADPFYGDIKGVQHADPLYGDVKGGQPEPEKGGNPADKRGAAHRADQHEPEQGLNRMANTSGSLSRGLAALAAAVPSLTEREIESISDRLKDNPEIPHPGPYLQAVIAAGDAASFAAAVLNGHGRRGRHGRQAETDAMFDRAMERARALDAAGAADGPRSEACKRPAHNPRDCGYRWCSCTCHDGKPREQLDDALPLAAIAAGVAQRTGRREPITER
jgi:hypothetical protein